MSNVLLKKVDPKLYARLKADAAARGKTVGQVFNEAVRVWLESRHEVDEERERNIEAYLRIKKELTKHPKEYFVIAKGVYRGRFRTLGEAFKAMKQDNETKGLIIKYQAGGEWLGGSLED